MFPRAWVQTGLLFLACGAAWADGPVLRRLDVPAIPYAVRRQASDFSCGASSLKCVFERFGVPVGCEESLWGPLGTNSDYGTAILSLMQMAQAQGFRGRLSLETPLGELKRAIEAGAAVIVSYQAWRPDEDREKPWASLWESGHYSVVVAVDDENVYLMDPYLPWVSGRWTYGYIPIPEFLERWRDRMTVDYDGRPLGQPRQRVALFLYPPQPAEPLRGCRFLLERVE